MKTIIEDLETKPSLQAAILGALKLTCQGITPHTHAFGLTDFSNGLTLSGIMQDQQHIGWINFFAGRWGIKWKEAQKRHYMRMNKKKSAKLWVVAILKKMMMIQCDLWQFRNQVLHSPTGPLAVASHHYLNY